MTTITFPSQETALIPDNESLYIQAATSGRAYQADITHFVKQGDCLPATPESIEQYLKQCAETHNPRTLVRRVTALRQWRKLQGVEDPTAHPLPMKTLRGIMRLHGRLKQQALALRLEALDQLVQSLKLNDTLLNCRNKALILIG